MSRAWPEPDGGRRGGQHARAGPAGLRLRVRRDGRARAQPAHRTQALHQTLAGLSTTTKTVQVTANWADFTGSLAQNGIGTSQNMTMGEFAETTRQIGHGFAALGLPLAAGQWAGLTTKLFVVLGRRAPRAGRRATEARGALPRPAHQQRPARGGHVREPAVPAGMVAVAATTQMAARFGLHPGSRLSVATSSGPVGLFVTAILRERAPGSTFWKQDPTAGTPALQQLTAGEHAVLGGRRLRGP